MNVYTIIYKMYLFYSNQKDRAMSDSQRESEERWRNKLEGQWKDLLSYVRQNYDEIGDILNSDVKEVRMECSEHGIEFTPMEVKDCLKLVKVAYDMITQELENN